MVSKHCRYVAARRAGGQRHMFHRRHPSDDDYDDDDDDDDGPGWWFSDVLCDSGLYSRRTIELAINILAFELDLI